MKSASCTGSDNPRSTSASRRGWRSLRLVVLVVLVFIAGEAFTRYQLHRMRLASPPPSPLLDEKRAAALASLNVQPEYDTEPDPTLDRDFDVVIRPGLDYRGSLESYAKAERSLWDELHWSYHPNSRLHADFGGEKQTFRINSHGFRSAEFTVEKPPGVYRIVCVGGSTTVAGSTNNTTYPALLEYHLQRLLGTDRVEVINTGISGLTSDGEKQKLATILSWQPDLIVESNGVNDIYYLILRDYLETMPFWKWVLAKSALIAWCFPDIFRPSAAEMAAALREQTMRNLQVIHDQAAEHKVDVVYLSFAYPTPELLEPEEREYFDSNARGLWFRDVDYQTYVDYADLYNEILIRESRQRGWRVIPLHQRILGGCDMFWDTCHTTVVGRVEKVKIIANAIRDDVAAVLAQEK